MPSTSSLIEAAMLLPCRDGLLPNSVTWLFPFLLFSQLFNWEFKWYGREGINFQDDLTWNTCKEIPVTQGVFEALSLRGRKRLAFNQVLAHLCLPDTKYPQKLLHYNVVCGNVKIELLYEPWWWKDRSISNTFWMLCIMALYVTEMFLYSVQKTKVPLAFPFVQFEINSVHDTYCWVLYEEYFL